MKPALVPPAILLPVFAVAVTLCLFPGVAAENDRGFSLTLPLPELANAAFSRGGALQVPVGPVKSIGFRMTGAAASHIDEAAIRIRINGGVFDATATHQSGLTLLVKDEDKDLLLPNKPTRISIAVNRMPEYSREWTVIRAEIPYALETAGDDEGVPVEITFDSHPFPIILGKGKSGVVTLKGTLNRPVGARLTIGGQPVPLTHVDAFSSAFSARVEIGASQDLLTIEANGKAASCRIFVPVSRL